MEQLAIVQISKQLDQPNRQGKIFQTLPKQLQPFLWQKALTHHQASVQDHIPIPARYFAIKRCRQEMDKTRSLLGSSFLLPLEPLYLILQQIISQSAHQRRK